MDDLRGCQGNTQPVSVCSYSCSRACAAVRMYFFGYMWCDMKPCHQWEIVPSTLSKWRSSSRSIFSLIHPVIISLFRCCCRGNWGCFKPLQTNVNICFVYLGILCEVATPSPFGEEGYGPGTCINLLGSHRMSVCDRMCACVCVCVCVCVILKPNRCSLTETKKWGMWLDGGWSVLAHFCGNEDLVLMKHRQYIAIWNMKQTNAKNKYVRIYGPSSYTDMLTRFLICPDFGANRR